MQKGLTKWCRLQWEQRKAAYRLRHGCRMRCANAAKSHYSRIHGRESRAAWAALLVPTVRQHAWKQAALPKLPLDSRHFIKPFCMWYRPYAVLDLQFAVINCRDDRWIPRPCKTPTVLKKNGPPREQAKTPFNRISRTTKKRHTLGCTALKVIG